VPLSASTLEPLDQELTGVMDSTGPDALLPVLFAADESDNDVAETDVSLAGVSLSLTHSIEYPSSPTSELLSQ